MSQYKDAAIGDTVYFWFAANGTDGAAGDGATPLYDVRLAGAAADAAPTASGTPTLLTHANYTDGLHEIAIDTTGYAEGEYAVFCTLTISTVNPAGFCGSFKLRAASSSTYQLVSAINTLTKAAGDGDLAAVLTAVGTDIPALIGSPTDGDIATDIANVQTAADSIDGKVDTAQADLDTITGTGGVLIGTDEMDRSTTLDVNTKLVAGLTPISAANVKTQCAAAVAEDPAIMAIDALTEASGDGDLAAIKTIVELALPAAAPDGAGGLPISDAGGLDLDTLNTNVTAIAAKMPPSFVRGV